MFSPKRTKIGYVLVCLNWFQKCLTKHMFHVGPVLQEKYDIRLCMQFLSHGSPYVLLEISINVGQFHYCIFHFHNIVLQPENSISNLMFMLKMAQIHRNFKKYPTGGLPAASFLLGSASHSPEHPPRSFESTLPCVADICLMKFENIIRARCTVRRQILTFPKHPTPENIWGGCPNTRRTSEGG
jgi:hypothetical protein